MNKRKFAAPSVTEAQVAALEELDQLPPKLKCLAPLLDAIREEREKTEPPPKLPVRTQNIECYSY